MRHLSRHITLNYGYFGYFRSQNIYRILEKFRAIVFVFGHLKMSSSQELVTCTAKMCNMLHKNIYQCVDNVMFY